MNPLLASVFAKPCAIVALTLCGLSAAHAQVKYFERVPTPAEVMAALRQEPTPTSTQPVAAHSNRPKVRGLEWNVSAASSEPTAEAPAPTAQPRSSSPALALPVNFDFATAKVSRSSLAYVEAVVAALNQNPGMRLVIEGHTDAAGLPRSNMMLSWERAFSVFRVMVDRYGIDPMRLQPSGKGATDPLVPTDPLLGTNRRVQFRILS